MTKDTITTVVGSIGAAVVAAQPVLNGVQGSLHTQDYMQLVLAICVSVFSYFTNKKDKEV